MCFLLGVLALCDYERLQRLWQHQRRHMHMQQRIHWRRVLMHPIQLVQPVQLRLIVRSGDLQHAVHKLLLSQSERSPLVLLRLRVLHLPRRIDLIFRS